MRSAKLGRLRLPVDDPKPKTLNPFSRTSLNLKHQKLIPLRGTLCRFEVIQKQRKGVLRVSSSCVPYRPTQEFDDGIEGVDETVAARMSALHGYTSDSRI